MGKTADLRRFVSLGQRLKEMVDNWPKGKKAIRLPIYRQEVAVLMQLYFPSSETYKFLNRKKHNSTETKPAFLYLRVKAATQLLEQMTRCLNRSLAPSAQAPKLEETES
jgi:hypothetical protein